MSKTLEFEGISKYFHGVAALKNISFSAKSGEVVALVGENGAGKSTLLKILGGDYQPTAGRYLINGEEKHFASPHDAIQAGVGLIYQERQMVPELTVAENIFMGRLPKKYGMVDFQTLNREAQRLIDEFELKIRPADRLKNLSVAMQQMVEILKVYSRNPGLIAFDEPTTALTGGEAEVLFRIIEEKLKKHDIIILYVSHRMNEIFRICDKIVVLKDGELVRTAAVRETTEEDVIKAMVGRPMDSIFRELRAVPGRKDTVLRVEGFTGQGFRDISFSLRKGEILGFFGLVGAGRTELMRGIFGADKISGGVMEYRGAARRFRSPKEAVEQGFCFLTEDRKDQGIFPIRSVRDNISITCLKKLKRFGLIDTKKENRFAKEECREFEIKTSSIHKKAEELSGGNQQKALLARWLAVKPEILILDEPTKGIDVGAKAEIYRIIREIANQGISVLLVSSELPEIIGLSDRICVMREGRITAVLDREHATEETVIGYAMRSDERGGNAG